MTGDTAIAATGYGLDTDTKILSLPAALRLQAASWNGHLVGGFLWRYVSLSQPQPGDVDASELAMLAGVFPRGVGLVQHCRAPGWTASGQLGQIDGTWAVKNALAAGYPPDMGLALVTDLEGLKNAGQPVADYVFEWASIVNAHFAPAPYVGFDAGLDPDELWAIPNVHRYLADSGPRAVSHRGFACVQQALDVSAGGFRVDVDKAGPDHLGGTLLLWGRSPSTPAVPA